MILSLLVMPAQYLRPHRARKHLQFQVQPTALVPHPVPSVPSTTCIKCSKQVATFLVMMTKSVRFPRTTLSEKQCQQKYVHRRCSIVSPQTHVPVLHLKILPIFHIVRDPSRPLIRVARGPLIEFRVIRRPLGHGCAGHCQPMAVSQTQKRD